MTPSVLPGVLVPVSLVANPTAIGGVRQGDLLAGDLLLRSGRVERLAPPTANPAHLVLPHFTDPHVHLDKCHTADRLPDIGGDLMAAIAAQRQDKQNWTADDIRSRARRGIAQLASAGCGAVRSHVDWGNAGDPAAVPLAWQVLGETDIPANMVLQRAALVDMPTMADAASALPIARKVAQDGGVLGTFVFAQSDRKAGIANAFQLADRFGLALDFHADEGLQEGLDGVEAIADAALHCGFQGPVLIGHACALMNRTTDDVARIAEKLARAGISVTALPLTNLHLQGRNGGTPDRRGLTRVRELRDAGVNVVLAADNVRDAFCPVGNHDPRQTLTLGILAAHLDPPLGNLLPMISTAARDAIGLLPQTVDGAAVADLICTEATSVTDMLCAATPPRPLSEWITKAGR